MNAPLPSRARPFARAAFIGFATVFFTATHWPALRVPNVVPRSDLWIHACALAAWTTLFIACSFFSARALTPRNIGWSVAIGVAYAGFDELTQAIPILHRTCALDDFAADATGGLLAGGIALFLARRQRARSLPPNSSS
jgi:VanZ family protein